MVFLGALAVPFFTVILGSMWHDNGRISIWEYLIGLIGKSLFLSWIIVVASYWLDLPSLFWPLCALVLGLLIMRWGDQCLKIRLEGPIFLLAVLTLTVKLCLHLFEGGFGSGYRLIFMTWDALASWNRWGQELAQNLYEPMPGAAYPILFPGIWSLIYKAQGDATVWVFAKLSLFIIPIILILLVALLVSEKLFFSAALVGYFVYEFFLNSNAFPMLQGNMDIPICTMFLTSGVLMYISASRMRTNDSNGAYKSAFLASVFVGLGAITKQQGAVMFAPLSLLFFHGFSTASFNFRNVAWALCVAVIPLATYLLIYLPLQGNPFGNVESLSRIAAEMSPHGSPYITALHFVSEMLPMYAWIGILVLSAVNLIQFRTIKGQLGIIFLILGFAAFMVYGKCCAYEPRNGWWVAVLLFISALFGLDRLDQLIPIKKLSDPAKYYPSSYVAIFLLAISCLFAISVNHRHSTNELRTTQNELQVQVAGYSMGTIIHANLHRFSPEDRLITEISPIQWLPNMKDRVAICGANDEPCIATQREQSKSIFVVIQPGVLEYPTLRNELTLENLIAEADSLQLYGPIPPSTHNDFSNSLIIEALNGKALRLTFDPVPCADQGLPLSLCSREVLLQYDKLSNEWTTNTADGNVSKYSNAPDHPGAASVAGAVGYFDRFGNFVIGTKVVGRLTLQ